MNEIKIVKGIDFYEYESLLNYMYFYGEKYVMDRFTMIINNEEFEYVLMDYTIADEKIKLNKCTLNYCLKNTNKVLKIEKQGLNYFKWTINGKNVSEVYNYDDTLDDKKVLRCYSEMLELNDLEDIEGRYEVNPILKYLEYLDESDIRGLNVFTCNNTGYYKTKVNEMQKVYEIQYSSEIKNSEYKVVKICIDDKKINIEIYEVNKYGKCNLVSVAEKDKGSGYFSVILDNCKDKIKFSYLDKVD